METRIFWLSRSCLLPLLNRLGDLALSSQNVAEVEIGIAIIRSQTYRVLITAIASLSRPFSVRALARLFSISAEPAL